MLQSDAQWPARRSSRGGWAISSGGSPAPHPTATPSPPPGRPLRAVLVDPDALARRSLRQLLEEDRDIAVVAECGTAEAALETVGRERPDLVLLELTIPDMDGFALARKLLPDARGGLIFVTSRPDGALEAFDVHAIGYLLKPVGHERLHQLLEHARTLLLRERRGSSASEWLMALLDQRDAERQRRARLLIRHADGAFFVRTEAIDWIEAAGKLVKVHAGRQVHVQREALARIEHHLDPERFVRISRSAIVNIDRIREIQPWFNGEYLVILDDDSQVATSRHYRANLRRLFGKGDEP
jgi:two-component system LytT family response regulator